jgi:hypothetical protein
MISLHLLFLCAPRISPAQEPLDIPAPEAALANCAGSAIVENIEDIADLETGKILGRCCAATPMTVLCSSGAALCKSLTDEVTDNGTILMHGDKGVQEFCTAWCDDEEVDWCPTKFSAGKIAGLVIGSIAGIVLCTGLGAWCKQKFCPS